MVREGSWSTLHDNRVDGTTQRKSFGTLLLPGCRVVGERSEASDHLRTPVIRLHILIAERPARERPAIARLKVNRFQRPRYPALIVHILILMPVQRRPADTPGSGLLQRVIGV